MKRYKIYTMIFEFDKRKSKSNRKKYGIDFDEARALWDDKYIVKIPSTLATNEEIRFLYIGIIDSRHWTAITTYREPDLIRIISVRRSRKQEIEIYES